MTTFSDTNVTHPAPHRTHTVLNQSAPRTDVNEFTLDTVLSEGVRRHDADWATGELTDIGALVGSAHVPARRRAGQHDHPRTEDRSTAGATGSTRSNTTRRITGSSPRPSRTGHTRRRGPTRSPARTSRAQRHS